MTQFSRKITLARQLSGTNWIPPCTSRTLLRAPTAESFRLAFTATKSIIGLKTALSSRPPSSSPSSGPSASRDWLRPQGRPTRSTPYSRAPPPGSSRTAICSSWNKGKCAFPGTCNFRHVCVLYLGNHQARSCSNSGRGPSPETLRPPVVTSSSVHRNV